VLKYSSITAFVAHYRALSDAAQNSAPLRADERAYLQEMEGLLRNALTESERDELGLSPRPRSAQKIGGPSAGDGRSGNQAARRRARAQLKLHHALAARGILIS
jgi:hypothetical protein